VNRDDQHLLLTYFFDHFLFQSYSSALLHIFVRPIFYQNTICMCGSASQYVGERSASRHFTNFFCRV
jgi:hypothetical protein